MIFGESPWRRLPPRASYSHYIHTLRGFRGNQHLHRDPLAARGKMHVPLRHPGGTVPQELRDRLDVHALHCQL